ncbi:hypothetical protein FAZ69_31650 [Trinickia terrae]|uniref:Uncharacterized protein n=1 Tax=Trinickia terrae TaxID=2571161 RepID=A0A4U1HD63_9BURK|nr:hypothetical protein [Trinickia terrae]TKC78811.1 hypothetical protein FAZ69_31650 [Trinickia terrae]
MKPFCIAAALVLLNAGCASTWSPATNQTGGLSPADRDIFVLHTTDDATLGDSSKLSRLTVGVGYPDTQLILPWFLNDTINFVNYR